VAGGKGLKGVSLYNPIAVRGEGKEKGRGVQLVKREIRREVGGKGKPRSINTYRSRLKKDCSIEKGGEGPRIVRSSLAREKNLNKIIHTTKRQMTFPISRKKTPQENKDRSGDGTLLRKGARKRLLTKIEFSKKDVP